MSNIVLYGMDISPPVRACLLTLRALGLAFEYREVNLLAGEHMTMEFQQRNPQHTVPLLDDGGALIWDSHAIVCYLVDKYGESDELYPKNLLKRAHVNQRLYFDASILYMALRSISVPYFIHGVSLVPKEKVDNVREAYGHLESFLSDSPYVTGDVLTVADLCCAATATSLAAVLDHDPINYPNITAWLERVSKLPNYMEDNLRGLNKYIGLLKGSLTIL